MNYLQLREVEVYAVCSPPSPPPPSPPPMDVNTLCKVDIEDSAMSSYYIDRHAPSTECHDRIIQSASATPYDNYCISEEDANAHLQLYFATTEISHVNVYNRASGWLERLGEHSISYRDASTGSWVQCAHQVAPATAGPFVTACAGQATGVQIRLEHDSTISSGLNYLNLAEVEVYAVCSPPPPSPPPSPPPGPPPPRPPPPRPPLPSPPPLCRIRHPARLRPGRRRPLAAPAAALAAPAAASATQPAAAEP